jgi:hypothetical protein
MYVFLYIFFLIPSKLWAFITVWNTEWGTSSRFARYSNILKALHALVWAAVFSSFLIFFLCKFMFMDKMTINITTAAVAAGCLAYVILLALHWGTWGRGFKVPRVK